MEQFGLWNLLKSMLSPGQQSAQNQDIPPPHEPLKTPPTTPPEDERAEKENACEQFLLRHETLRRKRK